MVYGKKRRMHMKELGKHFTEMEQEPGGERIYSGIL